MDFGQQVPDRPDAPREEPTEAPPSRRRSKAAAISTAAVVALVAGVLQLVGPSDGARDGDRRERVLLQDDFSDPESGWVTGRNADRDIAYEEGRYRVRVTTPLFQEYSYVFLRFGEPDALAIEVDVERSPGTSDGFVGVVCPTDREGDAGYALMVHPEEGQFMITEHDRDGWRPIRVARATAPLPEGPLRVRGECFGAVDGTTRLVLSVEDETVLSALDQGTSTFVGVGLGVWSRDAGTEVLFDDLTAWREVASPRLSLESTSGADVNGVDEAPTRGAVQLRDDFSDPRTGWFTADERDFRFSYVQGTYEILVGRPLQSRYAFKWFGRRVRTIGVEVTSGTARYTTPPGAGGPMCLAERDPVSAYAFALDQHAGTYQVLRIADDSDPEPIDVGRSHAILDSAFSNEIQATCALAPDGSIELALYVNGNTVASVTDARGFDRLIGAGLYAESDDGGTDIRFDDLVVRVER